MYQYDESDDYQIISENLNRTDESISHGFEMRKAHLKDLAAVFSGELIKNSGYADVMDAVCLSDESTGMYEKSIRFAPHNAFGSANETDFTSFSKTISDDDKIRFAKLLAGHSSKGEPKDVSKWLSGEESPEMMKSARIATTGGKQTNEAFEFFASCFDKCIPVESDSFTDVCSFVAKGEADFGVIPVSNTIDGRLSAYCSFVEENQLYIVMTKLIDSTDGENTTEFALVSGRMITTEKNENVFRIRLTLDDYSDMEGIFRCCVFNSAKVIRTDIIPQSVAGRENSVEILFDISNSDLKAIICYLKLNFPQFTTIGIYSVSGGNL